MIKHLITLLSIVLLNCNSIAQPLTQKERNWLIEAMGEPQGNASMNMTLDTFLLLEKKYPPVVIEPSTMEKIEALIKKDPENVDNYLYKFRLLYKNNKRDKALEVLNNAREYFNNKLTAKPDNFKYAMAVSDIFVESGNMQFCLPFWRALAIENYSDVKFNIQAMRYYMAMNQLDSVASYRDIAFLQDPLNPELLMYEYYYQNYYFISHTSDFQKNGKFGNIFSTEKILNGLIMDPDNRTALIWQYSLLAFQEYTVALINGADAGDLDSTLKISYRERKNEIQVVEKGLLNLLKTRKANPFLLYLDLMFLNTVKQDDASLTRYYTEAIKILPNNPTSYRLMAMSKAIPRRYADALGFITKAINLTHESDDYVFASTLMYRSKGADSALKYLNRNESFFADHTDFVLRRTWMAIATGDAKLALNDLESISEDDKKDKVDRITFYKAGALLVSGDRKEAGRLLKSLGSDSDYLEESKSIIGHFKL